MKPMLAHVYEPHRTTWPCYVQPKLNGIRALYQNGCFQSRDELPFPQGLLDHLAAPLRELFGPEVILDGELYVHGWPLQRINAAVTPVRQQPTEDTGIVEYHVFDVVDFNKSFEARFPWSYRGMSCKQKIFFVRTEVAECESRANEHYSEYVDNGYEGMMYRLGDCPYTMLKQTWADTALKNKQTAYPMRSKFASDKNNRCWHLLKRKSWQDEDYLIVGMVEGEGKLKGTLGALECTHPYENVSDLPDIRFSVGSGLTDAERAHYWQNSPVGRKAKVKFLCLSESGIPLNPTVLAIL